MKPGEKLLILAMAVVVLSACQPSVSDSPTPTETPEQRTVIALPSLTPTAAPISTPTLTSTPTRTPTPTPTPSPAPAPSPIVKAGSIPGNVILYAVGGSLKSSPSRPVFARPEMETVYDSAASGEGVGFWLIGDSPVPSPDGRWLAVNGPSPSRGGMTWLADLVTGDLRKLSSPRVWATWSPDSHRMTYVLEDTLYTLDVTGDHEPVAIWRQKDLFGLFARWSPTGEWIATASVERTTQSNMFTYWIVSPGGDVVRNLGAFPVSATEAVPQSMDWSPDGALLDTPSRIVLTLEGQSIPYSDIEDNPPLFVPPSLAFSLTFHDREGSSTSTFSHIGQQVAYDNLYIFDRTSQTRTFIGEIPDHNIDEIYWSVDDSLLVVGTRAESRSKESRFWGSILAIKPEPGSTPQLLIEGDNVYLVDVIPDPTR